MHFSFLFAFMVSLSTHNQVTHYFITGLINLIVLLFLHCSSFQYFSLSPIHCHYCFIIITVIQNMSLCACVYVCLYLKHLYLFICEPFTYVFFQYSWLYYYIFAFESLIQLQFTLIYGMYYGPVLSFPEEYPV